MCLLRKDTLGISLSNLHLCLLDELTGGSPQTAGGLPVSWLKMWGVGCRPGANTCALTGSVSTPPPTTPSPLRICVVRTVRLQKRGRGIQVRPVLTSSGTSRSKDALERGKALTDEAGSLPVERTSGENCNLVWTVHADAQGTLAKGRDSLTGGRDAAQRAQVQTGNACPSHSEAGSSAAKGRNCCLPSRGKGKVRWSKLSPGGRTANFPVRILFKKP